MSLRQSFRSLFRTRAFTVLAIVTVAIAIGANVTLYSAFDALVLHPIQLPEPNRLVRLWSDNPARNIAGPVFSVPKYRAFSEQQTVFTGVAASAFNSAVLTRGGVDPQQLTGLAVTQSYVPTLGLALTLGRNFTPDEDQQHGAHVCLISYELWATKLGKQPDIVGSTIELDGVPTTVVGVLKPHLPTPIAQVQYLQPWPFNPTFLTEQQLNGGAGFLQVTARLKPGVSIDAARREVAILSDRYKSAYPAKLDATTATSVHTWAEEQAGPLGRTFTMLLTAVAFVLLIACANVSNLFLGRLLTRRKEVAIRLSLGATPDRVRRQFLLESLIFAVLAGAVGLGMAMLAMTGLEQLLARQFGTPIALPLNASTLLTTAGLSVLACFFVGLAPAIRAAGVNVGEALGESTRGTVGGSHSTRLRAGLIVGEVALSTALLIGSALLVVSFLKLQSTRAGFSSKGIASAFVSLSANRYATKTERSNFYYQVMDKLRGYPGVKDAMVTQGLPLAGIGLRSVYGVLGRPTRPVAERPIAVLTAATEDYFKMLAVPVEQGRTFAPTDMDGAQLVCVISASMAKRLFPAGDAIGQTIVLGQQEVRWLIVGIVGDVKSTSLNVPPPETIYSPLRQAPGPFETIVAATDGNPSTLQPLIVRAVQEVDKSQAVSGFSTLDAQLSQSVGVQRMTAWVTAAFAGVALLLSVLGLYSVLAYAVAQRVPEISVRLALGAGRTDVIGLVLRQGMTLVALGLVVGVGGALAGARLIASLLYEVGPLDPGVFVGVPMLFLAVASAACLIPAWRASKVEALGVLKSG